MTYVFRLTGDHIDGQRVCCLGTQLAQIVTFLAKHMGDIVWYSADVEPAGNDFSGPLQNPQLLGQTNRLIALANKTDQFLSGVFFAVDPSNTDPNFRKGVETEDSVDSDIGDARVEIRAFDTAYFELYMRDDRMADSVAGTFGVQTCHRSVG